MSATTHRWGDPRRFVHKTERECRRCGLLKVTRHEVDGPRDVYWQEFWRGLEQLKCERTPPCDARNEVAA